MDVFIVTEVKIENVLSFKPIESYVLVRALGRTYRFFFQNDLQAVV